MDHQSIEQMTRHIKDVPRIKASFAELSPDEVDKLVDERRTTASIRWAQCHRSFQTLFMTMGRGNRVPLDDFELRLSSEQIGVSTTDIYVRVWRDRHNDTFNVKPFTKIGHSEDHRFAAETFSDTFCYKYGTHMSKTATLRVDRDDPDSLIHLTRIEGKQIGEMTSDDKAIYLGALDGFVMPSLGNTENTLTLICSAAMDEKLNPSAAKKFRINL